MDSYLVGLEAHNFCLNVYLCLSKVIVRETYIFDENNLCFLSFQPLPEFSRIRGCLLDGEAFADCLMSLEFLHNFAAALGFGRLILGLR